MHTELPATPSSQGGPTGGLTESIPGNRPTALGTREPGGAVIDRLGLTWIQSATDEAWGQVRSSLEAFAQDQANSTVLRPALEQVQHLAGVFGLMELPAARLTLLEAGRLLRSLQDHPAGLGGAAAESSQVLGSVTASAQPNAASVGAIVESLLVAASRVKLYVDLLRGGENVPILALLPACNGLRLAQGLPAYSPQAFLERLALMHAGPFSAPSRSPGSAREVMAAARALLERALLAWLKAQPKAPLAIARAFAMAAGVAPTREEGVLWWSGEILSHSMTDSHLARAGGLKPLLGRLNRELKRRAEEGFDPSPQTVLGAIELAHEVFSLLAQHARQHPVVQQAITLVGWSTTPPVAQEVKAAEQALLAAEPEVIAQAAEQLKAALEPVQDRFDLAVRSGDMQAILSLAPDLEQLASTMRMLELDAAGQALDAEASRLRDAQAQGQGLDGEELERVAGTLMQADVEIERLRLGLPAGEGIGAPLLVEAMNIAATQALEDLLLAKELLLTMWKDGGGEDRRGEVRHLLERVRGSFEMLSLPSWSGLVGGILDYTGALPSGTVPPELEQEAVADVFASLEYGLENLRDYRQVSERVLAFGERALERLPGRAQSVALARAVKEVPAPVVHADVLPPQTDEQPVEQPVVAEKAGPSPLDKVSASPGEGASAPAVAEQPLEAASVAAGGQPAGEVPRLVPEETDSEILEIFVEEARDVLEAIRAQYQQWRNNPNDRTALTELRRAFHTLKGSGRIIGAQLVGEFGWAFENLLNRVLDGTLAASDALFRLLEPAPDRLAQMLDALEGKPGLIVADVEVLIATAGAFLTEGAAALDRLLGKPKPTAAAEPVKEAAPATIPAPQESAVQAPITAQAIQGHPASDVTTPPGAVRKGAAPVPRIDPQLYEIFRSEVEGYLQTLRQAVERGRREGSLYPDAELIRVTHSLLGSARTAGAPRIVALASHLEHAMRLAFETQQVFDASLINLTDLAVDSIGLLLDDIGGFEVELPDLDRLVHELEDAVVRLQSAHESREAVEAAEAAEAAQAIEPSNALAEVEDADIPADQDQTLLSIFREEAEEILQQLDEALASWQREPASKVHQQALQRHLHTFKGGARMAGMLRMGDLAHHLENVFMDLEAGRYPANPALLAFMQRVFDHLHGMVDRLRDGLPIAAASDLVKALEDLREQGGVPKEMSASKGETAAPQAGEPATTSSPPPAKAASAAPALQASAGRDAAAPAQAQAPAMAEVLRVRAELLDRLVASAGESAIYHARLEQNLTGISRQLQELEQIVTRLRGQLRRMEIENEAQMLWRFQQETGKSAEEFDPLEFDRFSLQQELSRGVMESLGDIESVRDALEDALRDAEMLLTQQGRLGQTLQDGLMGARLVRFDEVVPRLKRLVRQVARDLGKQAELEVYGGEVELDRGLLNTLVPAFEHMLRNSLAHGIELPDERAARGKSREGRIQLSISSHGGLIEIALEDDGAGIDVEAVRRKAREKGILDAHAAEDDQAAMQLIFHSGISTAREVSMVAGRGVGMDVVAEALRQVGGDIQVDSRRGLGTRFSLHMPLTQAITQGIIITTADEQVFALPYSAIETILRVPNAQLKAHLIEPEPTWEHGGHILPLVDLDSLLGLPGECVVSDEGKSPLVILHLGERRMALRVDALQGSQQLFIKSLGPFLARAPALAGASLLADGRVVLVLDVAELFRLAGQVRGRPVEAQTAKGRTAQVLVVDDSITIRKVTTRILERYGIEVATAKDGVDALAWLQDHMPDVVLSDIEMPRMDGFELLASIRNQPRLRDLPVIMITSRTGQKHREKAESLGVNAYLGKPYTEADLLQTLRVWLPKEMDIGAHVTEGAA